MSQAALSPADNGSASRTSDRILILLKRQGNLCTAALSRELDLTEQGIRRHLLRLTEQGLIASRTEKPLGRGRPQQVYFLTERGEGQFPKRYPNLCLDILHHVQAEFGDGAVERVMMARAQADQQELAGSLEGDTLTERLEHLQERFAAAGYDSVIEEQGGQLYLIHRNCPHLAVAAQFGELCTAELRLIEGVLQTSVQCEARAAAGHSHCRYKIGRGQPTTDPKLER